MRYVIVGASAAGLSAAESILERDPGAHLTLVSEEDRPPYARPLISYWLAGDSPAELFPLPTGVLDAADYRRGRKAVALDPPARRITLDDGATLPYDRLLLATGAAARRLELPGEDAPNVYGFRTWSDAEAIDSAIRSGAQRAVVLGAGLVGVKASQALVKRGLEVVLASASPQPLSQAVDPVAGALATDALRAAGVDVRTGHLPAALEHSGDRVTGVRFSAPDLVLPCDLVVRGKGVEPRSELAVGGTAGQGIPADEELRTALPDVWVAGDAALCFDLAWRQPRGNAIWPAAVEQGRAAGLNMTGAAERYPGTLARNSVRIGDLHLVSAGVFALPGSTFRGEARRLPGKGYRAVVWAEDRLAGCVCAETSPRGPSRAGLLVAAVARGARAAELPFDPLDPNAHWGSYAFAGPPGCA